MRTGYTSMDPKWDFMGQVIGQLESVVCSYDAFCDIAGRLDRQDVRTWNNDYGDKNPLSAHLNEIEFPQDYLVIHSISEAYVYAVLSDTRFYRDWHFFMRNICGKLRRGYDKEFWLLPQEDREAYLAEYRAMYEGTAVLQVPQISTRDWVHFASDMEYCADVGSGAVISRTFADMCYFKKSKILHIRGYEGGFDVHVAMSRNRLLLVTCGCWQ